MSDGSYTTPEGVASMESKLHPPLSWIYNQMDVRDRLNRKVDELRTLIAKYVLMGVFDLDDLLQRAELLASESRRINDTLRVVPDKVRADAEWEMLERYAAERKQKAAEVEKS